MENMHTDVKVLRIKLRCKSFFLGNPIKSVLRQNFIADISVTSHLDPD